jgi:muramoyltetrapeptide carboxypeptidase
MTLDDAIVFLEDATESHPNNLDRDLLSLVHQYGFERVCRLVIGRFQKASGMNPDVLRTIVHSERELRARPVIASVDFGQTDPSSRFPSRTGPPDCGSSAST